MITRRTRREVKKKARKLNQDSTVNPFMSMSSSIGNIQNERISFFGGMKKTFVGSIIERKVEVKDKGRNPEEHERQIKIVTEIDREVIKATQKKLSGKKLRSKVNIFRDSTLWSVVIIVSVLVTLFMHDVRILMQYLDLDWLWTSLTGFLLIQLFFEVLLSVLAYPLYVFHTSFLVDILHFFVLVGESTTIFDLFSNSDKLTKQEYLTGIEFYLVVMFWTKMLLCFCN